MVHGMNGAPNNPVGEAISLPPQTVRTSVTVFTNNPVGATCGRATY